MRVGCFEVPEETSRETASILERIGDKWTILTIVSLKHGSMRFSELKRLIGIVSQEMLTTTLRGLERDGFITRTVTPTIPPRVLPWNTMQMERLGDGLDPDLSLTGEAAMAAFAELEGRNMAALLDRRGRRTA